MRKYISKIAIIFMMAFVIGIGYGVSAKAADGGVVGTHNLNNTAENSAKVGDQLKEPEKGWKRYDDKDGKIVFTGNWNDSINTPDKYNGTFIYSYTMNDICEFKFYGTKLRIIGFGENQCEQSARILIDGTEQGSHSSYSSQNPISQMLGYEKTDLKLGMHTIKIIVPSNKQVSIDSIEIDDSGYLLPYDSTTLTAASDNKKQNITLNWDKVDGAEKYIIKKSTTQGKEEKIQEVKENTYEDKDVQTGEKYYYIVIPVINGKEGTPSNEASATLEKNTEPSKPDTKGDAVLTITMTNGNIKSYNVSMKVVNDFIKWYEGRANGSNGTPFYKFDKTDGGQDFKNKTEYIIFDKISSFEVDEK